MRRQKERSAVPTLPCTSDSDREAAPGLASPAITSDLTIVKQPVAALSTDFPNSGTGLAFLVGACRGHLDRDLPEQHAEVIGCIQTAPLQRRFLLES